MTAGVQARVLLVAKEDSMVGPLAEGLDRLGWRTITARGPYAAAAAVTDLAIEAAIVDLTDDTPGALAMAERLKEACAPRRLPVIGVGDPGPHTGERGFDLILAPPLHPGQGALRLETLVRTAVAEEEFELRRETFVEHGRELELVEPESSAPRILAIGEPAPRFLAVSNALERLGAQVVGAFTAYTAFDYLHDRPFDAVILWAGENPQEAFSIIAGLRRNTRLYHTPALLYLQEESYVAISEAYHRGVSDVASLDTPEDETARRVLELARSFRRQSAVRASLEKARSSGLMDPATGLFTRDLFAAHLARLAQAARVRNRPLSVCVLKVADRADMHAARRGGWLDRALPQIGSMVSRLVRVEDTAARLGPEVFALALPATRQAAARSAGERIAAVIGCTAFDAGEGKTPFVVEFDIGVAEVGAPETVAQALEDAAAGARKAG